MFKTIIAVTFLAASFLGMPAVAASVDCNNASAFRDVVICSDPALSKLHEDVLNQYLSAQASSKDPNAILADQLSWVDKLDKCTTALCIRTLVTQRADEIQRLIIENNDQIVELASPDKSTTAANDIEALQQTTTPISTPVSTDSISHSVNTNPASPPPKKSNLPFKIAAVILLVICLTSMYLHHKGRLTIYHDYTDAAFTSFILLAALIFTWLLAWLEVPTPYPAFAGLGLGAVMTLIVIRSTIAANGFNLSFVMALITKITMIGVFYAIMAALLSSGSARKKGESQAAFAARQRRENREARAAMVAVVGIFTWVSSCLCRERQFSGIGDYIAGRTH